MNTTTTSAQKINSPSPRAKRPGQLRRGRPNINLTPVERAGRVAIGTAATITAVVLLVSAGSALAVVLEALLVAAGLDLVITGGLGHCPLYARFSHVPASLRRTP
jgi:hypothetical protein